MRIIFVLAFAAFPLACGFDLQCSLTMETTYNLGAAMSCNVSFVHINSTNETVTSFNSKVEPSDSTTLTFLSTTMRKVPKSIETFFPHLINLIIHDAKLESIDKTDLKPFKYLQLLSLDGNQLEILENDLFEFNPELRVISFDRNSKLKVIGSSLFHPLKNLQKLYFNEIGCGGVSKYSSDDVTMIISELTLSCSMPEKLERSIDDLSRNEIQKRVQQLEEQLDLVTNEKNKTLKEFNETLHSLISCDEILAAATKMLRQIQILNQPQQVHKIVNEEFVSNHSEVHELTLTVTELSEFRCEIRNLTIEISNTSIGKIHKINLHHADLKAFQCKELLITKERTHFLPMNLNEKFPFLTSLFVTSSELHEIDTSVLRNMKKLEVLSLASNKLREIPSDAFNDLNDLRKLDLSCNMIEKIESSLFKNLVKLEQLRINDNLLTTTGTEVFENLKSLKGLFLQNNKLELISAELISSLENLEILNLTNNVCINMSHPIEKLELVQATIVKNCLPPIHIKCNKIVTDACKVENFTIDYPKTKVLYTVGFSGDEEASTVQIFVVVSQSMKFLPYQMAQLFPKLESIVVLHSKLTELQKTDFEGCHGIRKMGISHNDVWSIEEGTFDHVPQLEHLDLSTNNIQFLPPKAFIKLIRLKVLVLSDNQIEKLTADILPPRCAIQEFRADENQLEMIELKFLRQLRKAKLIDLTRNNCIDMKFDKLRNSRTTLVELAMEIDFNCSYNDYYV